jgi:hypothetical protein
MKRIASEPADSHYFPVSDYASINRTVQILTQSLCSVLSTPSISTTTLTTPLFTLTTTTTALITPTTDIATTTLPTLGKFTNVCALAHYFLITTLGTLLF